tara:strand:- start:6368 stop:7702 length:1335 start_codon:yes stop_codon:yes gene_type:complete
MMSWLFSLIFFVRVLFIPDITAQSLSDNAISPTRRAELAFDSLNRWYNVSTGTWDSAGWWNNANIITTIGNLAKSDPGNRRLQTHVRLILALAFCRAPARNPQPVTEITGNGSFALYNATEAGIGYDKFTDAYTHEPHTTFPANWFVPNARDFANPKPNLDLSDFDEASLLLTAKPNPQPWLNGFYDDNLWWSLAWISAYDATHHLPYLHLAERIFAAMTAIWPTHCSNGGIYWSWKRDYVNAIPNELFFSTAAHLATRAHNKPYYLAWAQDALAWFVRSGMINAQGTVNDGLTSGCRNNEGTVWSYNQGVIVGALVELHRATVATAPNATYLALAAKIAHAALGQLSDANGILHDPCELNCGADGSQFKGVFMRGLQELQIAAPDEVVRLAIRRNAESIWGRDRVDGVFSVDWAGPFVWPANASTHSSAMDALVADVAAGLME